MNFARYNRKKGFVFGEWKTISTTNTPKPPQNKQTKISLNSKKYHKTHVGTTLNGRRAYQRSRVCVYICVQTTPGVVYFNPKRKKMGQTPPPNKKKIRKTAPYIAHCHQKASHHHNPSGASSEEEQQPTTETATRGERTYERTPSV